MAGGGVARHGIDGRKPSKIKAKTSFWTQRVNRLIYEASINSVSTGIKPFPCQPLEMSSSDRLDSVEKSGHRARSGLAHGSGKLDHCSAGPAGYRRRLRPPGS